MLIVIIFYVDYAIMYNDQIGTNMSPCDRFVFQYYAIVVITIWHYMLFD